MIKRCTMGLFVLIVFLLISGCISANPRVAFQNDRSVDILYTSIISSGVISMTPDIVSTTKTSLKKYGFTVNSREKSNGDQIITATKHLADISELQTQKINDTTNLFAEFSYTITTKNGLDSVKINGKMPVLDPPQNDQETASDQIRTRLTIKAPGKSSSDDADIIDGNLYEWEGNDAAPASFSIELQLPKFVPVSKIDVNKQNVSVGLAKTVAIVTTLQPSNATNKEISYVTQDKSKATVSKTGVITGVAKGQTTITVYNSDKTVNKVINVTITN